MIGLLFGPTMFLDYVLVDSKHCEARTGLPFFASSESVDFDNVRAVHEYTRISRSRRGGKTTHRYYVFHLKNGGTVEMKVSGYLRQDARQKIDEQLAGRGIQVVGAQVP